MRDEPKRGAPGPGGTKLPSYQARSQAFGVQYLRSSLLSDVAQRKLVIYYLYFGTICWPHLLKANMSLFLDVMTLLQEPTIAQLLEELLTFYEIILHLQFEKDLLCSYIFCYCNNNNNNNNNNSLF